MYRTESDGDLLLTLNTLSLLKSAERHGSAGQSQAPGTQGRVVCDAATAPHMFCMLLHDHRAPFASLCRRQDTLDTHLQDNFLLRTPQNLPAWTVCQAHALCGSYGG